MLHWTAEIVNGLIQHFSGHALWTIPEGTAFLLLIGVGVELSFMFAIMGLVFSMLLPDKPKVKVLGVPNRVFFAVVNAVVCSIAELILSKTPFFVWIYPWWGVVPVFFLFYVPAFLVSMYSFDWKRKTQKVVIGTMFGINVVMLIVFAGILGWI
jgi:hypothetical protein